MSEKTLKSLKFHGLNDIYKIPSTAEDVGATPASHLNNSDNPHNVTAAQVGARPSNWMPTAAQVGATPASHAANKNNPHGVTAEQVGARPADWKPTAAEIGAATPEAVSDAKMEAINESKAYTIQQVKNSRPYNLLDNSNFRNPVNQRGKQNYRGLGYGIDRWRLWHEKGYNGWMVSIEDGYIRVSDNPDSNSTAVNMLRQELPLPAHLRGKTVTLAARVKGYEKVRLNINNTDFSSYKKRDDWHTLTVSCALPEDAETFFVGLQSKNPDEKGYLCEWVALYEGEYTEETLPEYQPKGYKTELLICRQYDLTTDEYIGLRKFAQPRNLLDNSDFKNLVAQAGYLKPHGKDTYLADRWKDLRDDLVSYDEASRTLTFANTGSASILQQQISTDITGKTVTLAIKASNITNTVHLSEQNAQSGHADIRVNDGITLHTFVAGENSSVLLWSPNGGSLCIDWIALYEGEYTIATLPEYQPKGYGAELAECQRYYYQSWDVADWDGKTIQTNAIPGFLARAAFATSRLNGVELPVAMRAKPSITFYSTRGVKEAVSDYNTGTNIVSGVSAGYQNSKNCIPALGTTAGFTAGQMYAFHYSAIADYV